MTKDMKYAHTHPELFNLLCRKLTHAILNKFWLDIKVKKIVNFKDKKISSDFNLKIQF